MINKEIITKIIRVYSRLFFVLPVNKKRILFSSYSGKQYSCNPKYIFKYMRDIYPDYEYIWAFNHPENYSFLKSKNTRIIKYNSMRFLFASMTAKCIITNVELSPCVSYRKDKQLLLNTWHGGGCYKLAGYDTLNPRGSTDRLDHSYGFINTWVSSSEYFSKHVIRDGFRFEGKILETGMPRNDKLITGIGKEKRLEILKTLGLGNCNKKILLYAPSFREMADYNSVGSLIFDFENILSVLRQRDCQDYIFLCRAHHYMKSVFKCDSPDFVDVSMYPDMQDILCVADILITDYSSTIWDFSLRNGEIYLYTPDLVQYSNVRNFYKDIHTWGFPVATNEAELKDYILSGAGKDCGKKHCEMLNSYEQGNATKRIATYIAEIVGNN